MSQKSAKIIKINITSTHIVRVINFVRSRLMQVPKKSPFIIFTPNPEILLLASNDNKFAKILSSADILLADGIGLVQAAKFLSLSNPKNMFIRLFVLLGQGLLVGLATFFNKDWLKSELTPVKGRELFIELVKLANKKSWRVFLLGGKGEATQKTAEFFKNTLKKVTIAYASGPILDSSAEAVSSQEKLVEEKIIDKINEFKPHLLFVAFGAPKQEKWLYKQLNKLEIGGAITVGGAFDYISGKVQFPPIWMENLGLEWVWRLITQPWRFRRIFTAFPVFPLKVFWYKLNL